MWTQPFYSYSVFFIISRRWRNLKRRRRCKRMQPWWLSWLSFLPCTGFKFGCQPFSRVTPALLSLLTLSVAPYLKKPVCQTNLEDEVQPRGRAFFIGIVEQQLPTAIKRRVRAEPFFFNLLLSPPVFLSFCDFSPLFPNHNTIQRSTKGGDTAQRTTLTSVRIETRWGRWGDRC